MEPLLENFDHLFESPQDKNQILKKSSDLNKKPQIEAISTNLHPLPELDKLKPISSYKKNIILLLYGSFYPIHNNHLHALDSTKNFIESTPYLNQTYNIMGGFLMPTHMNNLKKKFGKPLLDNEIRLELCRLALTDSWITYIPILSKQKTNIGVTKVKKMLTDYINSVLMKEKKRSQKIYIVSVLGDDNIVYIEKNLQKKELFILKNREKSEKELLLWLDSEKIAPYKNNIIVINEDDSYEISSTLIRELLLSSKLEDKQKLINYLPPKVYKYLQINNIIFPVSKLLEEKPKENIELTMSETNISFEQLIGYNIPLKIQYSELISSANPQKLGEGVQGAVMSMIWLKPNEKQRIPVAVKMTDLGKDKGRRLKAFSRDLRALLLCNHNNIVHCYGAGVYGNKLFTVMERGLGLNTWMFLQEQRKNWVDKSKLPRKWFLYLAEMVEGLQHMSERGVLHRDLQLNNIVIFKRNENIKNFEEEKANDVKLNYNVDEFQLKICDFGVSALESDKHLIVRGSTRHYAPEALEDKNNYVSASDVYSFGNMMYEIVNGRKVFTDSSVEDMQIKVKMGQRPIFMKGSDLRLKEIIEKCWEHDLKKRPSFGEIAKYLYKLYSEINE